MTPDETPTPPPLSKQAQKRAFNAARSAAIQEQLRKIAPGRDELSVRALLRRGFTRQKTQPKA